MRTGGLGGGGAGSRGASSGRAYQRSKALAFLPIHSFICSTVGWPPFLLHSKLTKYLLCILSVPSSRNYVSGAHCVQSPVLVGPTGPHFENHPSRHRCQLPSLTRCAETWKDPHLGAGGHPDPRRGPPEPLSPPVTQKPPRTWWAGWPAALQPALPRARCPPPLRHAARLLAFSGSLLPPARRLPLPPSEQLWA